MASPVVKLEISKCKVDKGVIRRRNASILLYLEGNYFTSNEKYNDVYSGHDQDAPSIAATFNGKVYQTQPKLLNSGITFLIPYSDKLESLSIWLVLKDKFDVSKSEIIGTSTISIDNLRKHVYSSSNSETTYYVSKIESNQKVGKISLRVAKSSNDSSRDISQNLSDPSAELIQLFNVDVDKFVFQPLNQPVDWERFKRVCRDLDVIKSTNNTKVASAFLSDVSCGNINYDKNVKNFSFVKAIQIAQYATQYLSNTQSTLSKRENLLKDSLSVLTDEEDVLNEELVKYKAKYRALLRENNFLEQLQKESTNLLAILSPEHASTYLTRMKSYPDAHVDTGTAHRSLNITEKQNNITVCYEKTISVVQNVNELLEIESLEDINDYPPIDPSVVSVPPKLTSSEKSDDWCTAPQSVVNAGEETDAQSAYLPTRSEQSPTKEENDSLVVSKFDISDDSPTDLVPEATTISVEEMTMKALKYIETLEGEDEEEEPLVHPPMKCAIEPVESREKASTTIYQSIGLSSTGAMSVDSLNVNSFTNQEIDYKEIDNTKSNKPTSSQSINFDKLEDIEDISFDDRKSESFVVEEVKPFIDTKKTVRDDKSVDAPHPFEGVISRQARMDEHDNLFSRPAAEKGNSSNLHNSNDDKISEYDYDSRNNTSKNDNVVGFDLSSDLDASSISIGPVMVEPTKGKMNRMSINRYGNDDDDDDDDDNIGLKPNVNTLSTENSFGRTQDIDDNVILGGTAGTNKLTSSLTSDLSVSDFSVDQSMELEYQINSMIPSNTVAKLDPPSSPPKTPSSSSSSSGPTIWSEGRATADNVEVGMALDFLLSGVNFNDNFESETFYVQFEFMKKKSLISQLFRCVCRGSAQPINFAAHINFNRETSVLLSDEIEEESDNLCVYVNILDGNKRIIGEANVFLYVMIEESTNIIRQETEILSIADSDIVIGECICDVKGFSTLKRCS